MDGRRTYTDPATGIRYDTSNPDYQGWLTKQSVWLKDWRRRYFILKSSKLFFCKSENSTPHGMIDLASCMTVKSAEYKAHKRNALEVRDPPPSPPRPPPRPNHEYLAQVSTPDTTYLMHADTEKEKDDWRVRPRTGEENAVGARKLPSDNRRIGAIGRAIVRCSSTYTNDDGMEGDQSEDEG